MALTYIGSRFGDEETAVSNESETALRGIRPYLAVCEKLEGRDARSQRWAIKQERMDNLGQWKHANVENPEWNKRALSWPVNDKGELIDVCSCAKVFVYVSSIRFIHNNLQNVEISLTEIWLAHGRLLDALCTTNESREKTYSKRSWYVWHISYCILELTDSLTDWLIDWLVD